MACCVAAIQSYVCSYERLVCCKVEETSYLRLGLFLSI